MAPQQLRMSRVGSSQQLLYGAVRWMGMVPAARSCCIAVRNTKSAQRCPCVCILTSRGYLDRKQLRSCFSGICGSWKSGHVITDPGYVAAYMHAHTHNACELFHATLDWQLVHCSKSSLHSFYSSTGTAASSSFVPCCITHARRATILDFFPVALLQQPLQDAANESEMSPMLEIWRLAARGHNVFATVL